MINLKFKFVLRKIFINLKFKNSLITQKPNMFTTPNLKEGLMSGKGKNVEMAGLGGLGGNLGGGRGKRLSVLELATKNVIVKEKIIERALTNKFATIKRRRTTLQNRKQDAQDRADDKDGIDGDDPHKRDPNQSKQELNPMKNQSSDPVVS